MRFPPDRAGWIVVTRNYRLAVGVAAFLTVMAVLSVFAMIRDAARHRPFQWSFALLLLVAVVWAVRMLANAMWLRHADRNEAGDSTPGR